MLAGKPEKARGASAPPESSAKPVKEKPAWVADLKRFERTSALKVAWQLLNTLLPYAALLILMYLTMSWKLPYWITFLLALPAGALLVRIFIFFHDCGHGSFVAPRSGRR